MRLEAGVPTPDFSAVDLNGNAVTREGLLGKRVWLVLGRFAACPFCSLRLAEVSKRHPTVADLGVELVVVFPSPEPRARNYVEKYQPGFRVVADPEQHFFKAFGSETSWAGELRSAINIPKVMKALARAKQNPLAMDGPIHLMPSEYLIDPSGNIAHVHYGEELDDGFPFQEVLDWAKAPPSA